VIKDIDESKAPLLEHLVELRKRLIYSVIAIVVLFLIGFYFSDEVYNFLAYPLKKALGNDAKLITTDVLGQLWVRVEIAFYAALMVGFPFLANQVWLFVAPGLYRHEKKAFLPFLLMTPVLFSLGVTLAYNMLPFALKALLAGPFALGGVGGDLDVQPDIQKYLSFIRQILFAFGFCFLLPVLLILLNKAGILPLQTLIKGRRYAILIAFVVAAVITPPDVFSQLMLAIPLCLLYELSIFVIYLTSRDKPKEASQEIAVAEPGAAQEGSSEPVIKQSN
jgi:sec-independent protein translocase protein TatC